jgi:hypothetical protein
MHGLRKERGELVRVHDKDPDHLKASIRRVDQPRLGAFSSACPAAIIPYVCQDRFASAVDTLNKHIDAFQELGDAESMLGGLVGAFAGAFIGYRLRHILNAGRVSSGAMGAMLGAYVLAHLFKDRSKAREIFSAAHHAQAYFDDEFTEQLLSFGVMPVLHAHCNYNPSCMDQLCITKASHVFFRVIAVADDHIETDKEWVVVAAPTT